MLKFGLIMFFTQNCRTDLTKSLFQKEKNMKSEVCRQVNVWFLKKINLYISFVLIYLQYMFCKATNRKVFYTDFKL